MRLRGWQRIGGASFALLFLVWAAGWVLVVPDDVRHADVILVLGGDGPPRAAHAAALFRAGLASRVLVSGDGDCLSIRDAMVAGGVPIGAVLVECWSGSTFENAAFSAPILAQLDIGSALLVTSWFHMRRALACLSGAAPNVQWAAASAPPAPNSLIGIFSDAGLVIREVAKLAWYAWRYGIVPDLSRNAPSSRSLSARP